MHSSLVPIDAGVWPCSSTGTRMLCCRCEFSLPWCADMAVTLAP